MQVSKKDMLFQKNIYDVSGKFSKAFLKESFSTFLKPGSISGVSEASLQMGSVIYYDKNAKVLYLRLWFESPKIAYAYYVVQYPEHPHQPTRSACSLSVHQMGKLCLM